MLATKKRTKITQFFLKFVLFQTTILNAFEEFNRIINYMNTDLDYQPIAQYMLKTSMIPKNQGCFQFYDPAATFVNFYGELITRQAYMGKIQTLLQSQYVLFQVTLVGLTVMLSLIIELISFVWDDNILVVLDNLFTLLMPHYCLYLNTISWGDLCIQQSPIFNVLQFSMIGKVGFITTSSIVILLILLIVIYACNVSMSSPLVFVYGCLICLFGCYVITIDIINLYSSIYILRVIIVVKMTLMGFQIYLVTKR